ncbi:MAG: 4'-phosphopantetheinyl transferase superfamily protein [Ruminococcaceae bacterium]|nr:4'-phosphopantetheinyl transferase superfamily protein [Oscillospiraceae bacterium]
MNRVKTYFINCDFLSDSAEFEKHCKTASPYRRKKIDSLRFDSDKRLCLGADILLHRAFGCLADSERDGENGDRPQIDGVNYSVSHSGSIAMLTVGDCEVGCDIQLIDKTHSLRTAEKFFTDNENTQIKESENPIRTFFRLWAIKESYIKMLGTGLATPLDSFEVNLGGGADIDGCSVKEYFFFDGYVAAVCTKGSADFSVIKE